MAPAAHVFVEDIQAPVLDEADRHHLGRVLRLRPGEEVTASDGAGRQRPCRVAGGSGPALALEPVGPATGSARPRPALTIAFALTKGERPEWVVQKMTEAGVDRIVPIVAARSVVRWDSQRAEAQVERLRQVARGAAMQSRRLWLPAVDDLRGFAEAAEVLAPEGAALAQPGGDPPTLARPTVLVGPEGGWSPSELASGLARVSLGPTVLRAETAAMAAAVLLGALRAGLVRPLAGAGPGSAAEPGGSNTQGGNGA